jgi:hypothetical protein
MEKKQGVVTLSILESILIRICTNGKKIEIDIDSLVRAAPS